MSAPLYPLSRKKKTNCNIVRALCRARARLQIVFVPLNEAAQALATRHADLLDTARMPPALLQLVAHASAVKVLIR